MHIINVICPIDKIDRCRRLVAELRAKRLTFLQISYTFRLFVPPSKIKVNSRLYDHISLNRRTL